jgi:hypothetical protein
VSIVGLLLITAGRADAQIVSITATNYAAGPPQSTQPKGQYSVPVAEATASWRILIDYGTIANGEFTPWQAGANITINPTGGGGIRLAARAATYAVGKSTKQLVC